VEKDPVKSEDNDESSEDGRENIKTWIAENLRMIVSVLIVVVIAGGIYAYSKRAQAPDMGDQASVTEEGKISVIGGDSESATTESDAGTSQEASPKPTEEASKPSVPAPTTSQETESAFVETAAKGDGSTKLARRALANYLEKNPDAGLTAEHKIYIEDFLRRQVKNGNLKVGETREFSKDAIAKAIEKSKGLNERQLENLKQFSKKVPDLK